MVAVRIPSLAKINLDLRVLGRRGDGYHELRTIFQTISLRDILRIGFVSQKRFELRLESSVEIADNLVARAAHLAAERFGARGRFEITLQKSIPMGAGLGGGSSNAAATLIAVCALAGKRIPPQELAEAAAALGSDVPFFICGGTALAIGRGTELYPLPEQPVRHVLVVFDGTHVSTAEAYRSLNRPKVTDALTSLGDFPILREFQAVAWGLGTTDPDRLALTNDFEKPVFETHSALASLVRKLRRLGARPALMTGSGSAVFGLFGSAEECRRAAANFSDCRAFPARFVSQKQYRGLFRRALGAAGRAYVV